MTISGTREEDNKQENKHNTHSRFLEKFYGSFNRFFTLPSSIDEEKIEAHFANGVLELSLPKTSKSKGREILVKEGKRETKIFSNLLKSKKEAV